jgi:CheY-like chemotaxis protein
MGFFRLHEVVSHVRVIDLQPRVRKIFRKVGKEIHTIMLIDDDRSEHLLFREVLKGVNSSIQLISAWDGEEGLELLNKLPALPDLIFLDLNMPRICGKECLRQLREVEILNEIPVIIFTTSNLPQEISMVQELGASYFLTKPSLSDMEEVLSFFLSDDAANEGGRIPSILKQLR